MKCRLCNEELITDEKRNCLVCPNPSHAPKSTVKAPEKTQGRYIDVEMTEKRVREIVRDELENWHIPKPPVTKTEVEELTSTNNAPAEPKVVDNPVSTVEEMDWRAQAKVLDISLYHKKKVDVLAEIEERNKEQSTVESSD